MIIFTIIAICLSIHPNNGMVWGPERGGDQCEIALKEMSQEDRAIAVDDTSTRLHATWMSQECEARAGFEFMIRKYTFYENGTFLLIRYHYAEESCTVPSHTVTATGIIDLLSPSPLVPGATETRYHLAKVYITPLNRQIAYKLGHRVNVSCSHQPKWRPYEAHLIYDRAMPQKEKLLWESPKHNSLDSHQSRTRRGLNCLEPTAIDFDELKLLRVQKKPYVSKIFSASPNSRPWVELLLASVPPNQQSRRNHKSTSLQPTALLRSDTISGCPICGAIVRSTINSPPLLHESAPLPALIGGSWLSFNCESTEGGLWLRRQIQFHAGDKLWAARWDYFADPQCNVFLYSISGAGSYVQRAGNRQRRHYDYQESFAHESEQKLQHQLVSSSLGATILRNVQSERIKSKRSLDEESYKYLLQDAQPSMIESFTAMLRGNSRKVENKEPNVLPHPLGTTELDLHVAESLLIPGDLSVALRCGGDVVDGVRPMTNWPRTCIPKTLEAPTTLGLRAKIGVNWSGQYTLTLGLRDDNIWFAPLVQCGPASSHNPQLRAHLRRSVGLRFGLISSDATREQFTIVQIVTALFVGSVFSFPLR